MVDDFQAWLEARFVALEQKFESIMTRVTDVTAPMTRDIERLRGDINVLFDRQREVESDMAITKADKQDKQNNTATIVAVLAVVGGLAIGIIGFVIK